jgi:hypothetical protein
MKHIKLYEEQHKTPFKIYGESVIEIINSQWTLHKENKEQERKAKVRSWVIKVPYILESNPHLFYSFRGLNNQMRIRFACGLDSRSRAGFWKND